MTDELVDCHANQERICQAEQNIEQQQHNAGERPSLVTCQVGAKFANELPVKFSPDVLIRTFQRILAPLLAPFLLFLFLLCVGTRVVRLWGGDPCGRPGT